MIVNTTGKDLCVYNQDSVVYNNQKLRWETYKTDTPCVFIRSTIELHPIVTNEIKVQRAIGNMEIVSNPRTMPILSKNDKMIVTPYYYVNCMLSNVATQSMLLPGPDVYRSSTDEIIGCLGFEMIDN